MSPSPSTGYKLLHHSNHINSSLDQVKSYIDCIHFLLTEAQSMEPRRQIVLLQYYIR